MLGLMACAVVPHSAAARLCEAMERTNEEAEVLGLVLVLPGTAKTHDLWLVTFSSWV